MRLECPACGAAYEAPEGAITREGRWVRCSACRAEWMARGPAPTVSTGPEAVGAGAARERVALGGARDDSPAAAAAMEQRPAVAATPDDASSSPKRQSPAIPAPRDAAPARDASAEMAGSFDEKNASEGRGSAALMALVACLGLTALAAILAYLRHDAIAAAAPQLAEPLAAYVDFIDTLKARLGAR